MKNTYSTKAVLSQKISAGHRSLLRIPVIVLAIIICSWVSIQAQTTIFSESMGSVSSTTAIAVHEANNGFDNDAFTMTDGGAANPGDVRSSSASSGYPGASAGANIWLTSTAGDRGFAIEGIDASSYSSLTVQFGYRKESSSSLPILALDYWDGSAYVNVPFTFNEAANAATGWYLSPVIALPAGAQINLLKLRWVKSGTIAVRIDDVVFKGTEGTPSPTLTVVPSTLTGFNYTEGNGPSASQTYDLSGSNLDPASGSITIACATNYEVSNDDVNFSPTLGLLYSGGSLASTTIYVRLEAGLSGGTYNGELVTNSGGGATTQNVTCDGYVVGGVTTYTWTGASDNDWQVATNWNPNRTSPAINDILQFSNSGTYTITNVPAQTIAQLSVTAGTKITLEAAATGTLTIAGDTGDDLVVSGSGSELNVSGANALSISLNTGATAAISGAMTLAGTSHKLLGADAGSVTFGSGAVFTAGTSFSGNAFGNSSPGSVVFESGSTYIFTSGSNPFATNPPVTIFNTGSLYLHLSSLTPSFSGRTYANFELDATGASINTTGTSAVSIDNLTITNGTLNINMTATPGHSIKGNITVANGAALNFNPSAAGTINLNGTSAQNISGAGSISANNNSTINIDNAAGVTLSSSATLNNLSIASGAFTVASGASLITTGTVPASVNVERFIGAWVDALHGWHFLSSPMTSQAIAPNFTDPTPANYDFYAWDEVNNLWLNQKEVGNGITNFNPGTGYLVAYQSAGTKQFSGTLNTTDVLAANLTQSGGANNGWNLAGNPFPSALVWNDGVNWTVSADFAATAKIWNEANASYTDIAANGIIPALNGFMVQVVANSPASLTIPTAARTHDATAWYKSSSDFIKLVAYDNTNNTAQECFIKANEMATEAYDAAYDSRFLAGYAPQLYAMAGSEILSTNTLPNLDEGRTIEMGFVKNSASQYSIALDPESSLDDISIYLTDKKTGIVTDLAQEQEYSFTAEEGDATDRFRVHFGALGIGEDGQALPFNVFAANGVIYLNTTEDVKADIRIVNILGQNVMQSRIEGAGTTVIDAAGLVNGIYFVSVSSDGKYFTEKVYINR
jgi:hypothetical protein